MHMLFIKQVHLFTKSIDLVRIIYKRTKKKLKLIVTHDLQICQKMFTCPNGTLLFLICSLMMHCDYHYYRN